MLTKKNKEVIDEGDPCLKLGGFFLQKNCRDLAQDFGIHGEFLGLGSLGAGSFQYWMR